MRLAAVVFDFDGTLAATKIDFALMRQRVVEVLKRYGAWDQSLEQNRWTLEMIQAAAERLKSRGEDATAMVRQAHAEIEAVELLGCTGATLFHDAPSALQRLAQAGLRIGIITRNCRRVVNLILSRYSLPASCVVARDDAPALKPHPGHLLAALQALACAAEETVMVGDHVSDVQCALAAGAVPVAIAGSSSSAEELVAAGAVLVARSLTEATDWILRQV